MERNVKLDPLDRLFISVMEGMSRGSWDGGPGVHEKFG